MTLPTEESLEERGIVGAIDLAEQLGERWRRLQEVSVEQPREPPPHLLKGRKLLRVVRAQSRERLHRRRVGIPDDGGLAVGERTEQVRVLGVDVQTVAAELEIVDDGALEHVADVGARRRADAGPQLLGDAGAADELAPLEHQHVQAGPRDNRRRRGRCGRRR